MTDRPKRRYSPGRTKEYRAQTALVQYSAYRESTRRRNVASSHIVKMGCLQFIARLLHWGGRGYRILHPVGVQ
jgi:hypothetical protein